MESRTRLHSGSMAAFMPASGFHPRPWRILSIIWSRIVRTWKWTITFCQSRIRTGTSTRLSPIVFGGRTGEELVTAVAQAWTWTGTSGTVGVERAPARMCVVKRIRELHPSPSRKPTRFETFSRSAQRTSRSVQIFLLFQFVRVRFACVTSGT